MALSLLLSFSLSPDTPGAPRAGGAPSPGPPAVAWGAPVVALGAVAVPAASALITSAEMTRPPGPVPTMFCGGDDNNRGEELGGEGGGGRGVNNTG